MKNIRILFQPRKAFLAFATCASLLAVNTATADLAVFSRANCVNNESISYDPDADHWMRTKSSHYILGFYAHCKDNLDPEFSSTDTCEDDTWAYGERSGAVHWGEGLEGNWTTHGIHYEWTNAGQVLLGVTSATDCNINSFTQFYDQFFK